MGSVPGLGIMILHAPWWFKKTNRPLSGWVSPPQQGEELLDLVEAEQGAPTPPGMCVQLRFFLEKMKAVFLK